MNLKLPKEFESYKPKVSFTIDTDRFIIKTAETKEELLGVFHLRHNIFYKERKGVLLPSLLSIDEFDIYGDQLIILYKKNNQVVGAYRFIPLEGKKSSEFFCNRKFFDISDFIKQTKGNIVEMEWACVDKNLRAKRSLHYLWLGMARYFKMTQARYISGQINILNSSAEEVASIYKTFLEKGLVNTKIKVYPASAYTPVGFDKILLKARSNEQNLSKISRLFTWYLKMGGQVHGPPMFDPEFNSYGFFMSLDFKNIQNFNLLKRYKDTMYLKNLLP